MRSWKTLWIAFLVIAFCICLSFPGKATETASDIAAMFDAHGAVILLTDAENDTILYANDAAASFYGYTRAKLITMKMSDLNIFTPEEIAEEEQAAAEENRSYYVFTQRLANGEKRTVEYFAYPSVYDGKDAQLVIIHDITAKTLLQEKNAKMTTAFALGGTLIIMVLLILVVILIENAKKLHVRNQEMATFNALVKTFIDADNGIVYLKNEQLQYVLVNHAAEAYYKKLESEILGQDDFALVSPEMAEKFKHTDLIVLEEQSCVRDEIDLDQHTYRINKFPVKMMNGKTGIGGHIKDITDEKTHLKMKEKELDRTMLLLDILNQDFHNQQEQMDYVLHELLKVSSSEYGYICFYDEEKGIFTLNAKYDGSNSQLQWKDTYDHSNAGMWGEVVRQRKPLIVNDFKANNPLKNGQPENHAQLNNFMSIPIIIENKIVAVLGLANKHGDYDNNDVYEMTLLMGSIWNDIERRIVQEKLSYERHRYLQTLISIGDGVMVVNTEGRIEILNKVAQDLTGWTDEEAIGKHYSEIFNMVHQNNGQTIKDPIKHVLETEKVQETVSQATLTSRNGNRYLLEDSAAPIKDNNGQPIGVVLVFRDVTEKEEQRHKIEYLSFHDYLTGLYNRRFFEEEMARLDTERNLPISVIVGDVNDLKLANDIFGHAYGDKLLKKVAEILRKACRADDIIARWGGDEFLILLTKTNQDEAQSIITRIHKHFAEERIKAINVSISMGCSTKEDAKEDIVRTIRRAEEKMYMAKTLNHADARSAAIDAIIGSLHENNAREKEHSLNVTQLCQEMGNALHLSESEIRKLKDAAYLHDIGKIVLDPELLHIDRALTKKEWMETKRHPVVGFRILNSFDGTIDLAETILAHHEWWDGKGYPKGLNGTEIPLFARIISLADTYDYLTNDAKNQTVKTKEEAIKIIKEKSGTQFDPELVDIFIQILEKENDKETKNDQENA